jgi:hypothetical protein
MFKKSITSDDLKKYKDLTVAELIEKMDAYDNIESLNRRQERDNLILLLNNILKNKYIKIIFHTGAVNYFKLDKLNGDTLTGECISVYHNSYKIEERIINHIWVQGVHKLEWYLITEETYNQLHQEVTNINKWLK